MPGDAAVLGGLHKCIGTKVEDDVNVWPSKVRLIKGMPEAKLIWTPPFTFTFQLGESLPLRASWPRPVRYKPRLGIFMTFHAVS